MGERVCPETNKQTNKNVGYRSSERHCLREIVSFPSRWHSTVLQGAFRQRETGGWSAGGAEELLLGARPVGAVMMTHPGNRSE